MNYLTNFCLLLLIIVTTSCSKTTAENTPELSELTGKWKLTETLADPGDGSGRWTPVEKNENHYIRFNSDGSFTSSNPSTIRSYQVTDSVTLEFTLADKTTYTYQYRINREFLLLNPPCIEACGSRYIRVE